ncbi:flavin-containing monooxygenase [Streptomyces sp. NPDC057638]|uniref:flavin-containing monooxygenase n=1 Tax=Streptomyces sp. NPDC057638 TaxID=3346190 RepID=UPI0036A71195
MDTAIVIGGGQSGLAAAFTLRNQGFQPIVLEAGTEAVGSWPRYYDSLRTFSPARLFSLPGMAFPAPRDHLPVRDEVVGYLRRYASRLDCEIRTGQRVVSVLADRDGYVVATDDGGALHARVVVAASGNFDNPYRPGLPALASFTGTVLHTADYRSPAPFEGQRIVVVGAGSSAVQIAVELAERTPTLLASRRPIRFTDWNILPQHEGLTRLTESLFRLPVGPLLLSTTRAYNVVPDPSRIHREAFARGVIERLPMFTDSDGDELRWADGRVEKTDTIILGTGYRPALEYLRPIGALDRRGLPRQRHGISTVHPGLAFVGIEGQHTVLSNGLHGVGQDAAYVARRMRRRIAGTHPALRRHRPGPAPLGLAAAGN